MTHSQRKVGTSAAHIAGVEGDGAVLALQHVGALTTYSPGEASCLIKLFTRQMSVAQRQLYRDLDRVVGLQPEILGP
jgi:hypothetical protein